jgi:hypothetical protein
MKSILVTESTRTVRWRYRITFMSAMGVYCLAVAGISGWLGWEPPRTGWGLYLTAVLPAFPVGVAILAMGRYLVEEPDEFLRMLQVKATLVAVGLTMFTCTAWGFISQYGHVWALPLFLVFPMWALWFGITAPFVLRRYR